MNHATLFLADALPDSEFVRNFFTVLGWLAAVGAALWKIVSDKGRERIIGPSPLITRKADEFVTREEFNNHKSDHRRELEAIHFLIEKRFDSLNAERGKSLENLHRHISSMADSLKTDMHALDERIGERLREGNSRMNDNDRNIAALQAEVKGISARGGKR